MGIKLLSSGGGSVEINPPSTASNFVATMPAGTGTVAVQGVSSNIVSGTSVTASGTSVDFTGIPSWVKRITVMFSGVSTSGTSVPLIQIGAGSVTTSGYVGGGYTSNVNNANSTTGFITGGTISASINKHGIATITLLGSNLWLCSYAGGWGGALGTGDVAGGSITLAGTLDRVRITTVNGTNTFDAGSINILYE
jgi:hypothetical protein